MMLFNSCQLDCQRPRWFTVGGGCACLLKVAGLAEQQTVPILMWVGDGPKKNGMWVPAKDLEGQTLVATAEDCLVLIKTPGCYTIDVSAIPLSKGKCDTDTPCVTASKEKITPCELEILLPDCAPPTYTKLEGCYEGDTGWCLQIYLKQVCVGKCVKADLVYLNPTTKEWTVAEQSTLGTNANKKLCTHACKTFEILAADGPVTETTLLDLAVEAGLTYPDGTLVAATDAVNHAQIHLLPQNAHVGSIAEQATTTTCNADVECPTGSGNFVNLDPGGSTPVGSRDAYGIPITFTSSMEDGSAVRIDATFSRCGPEGAAQPYDPNA